MRTLEEGRHIEMNEQIIIHKEGRTTKLNNTIRMIEKGEGV